MTIEDIEIGEDVIFKGITFKVFDKTKETIGGFHWLLIYPLTDKDRTLAVMMGFPPLSTRHRTKADVTLFVVDSWKDTNDVHGKHYYTGVIDLFTLK